MTACRTCIRLQIVCERGAFRFAPSRNWRDNGRGLGNTAEGMMNTVSVDDLLTADSHLTRSFIAAVVGALAVMAWAIFFGPGLTWVAVVLTLVQFGCYVWYALAAGEAA